MRQRLGEDEWPLERYGVAARHFGQFNGAYLVGRPLPPEAWWGGADVRNRLALAEPGIHELPHLRHHPLFAELLAGDRVERILHLWAERERLLAGLARLPQTLCHRDAFRRNLMTRQSADGCEQTVVLDWAATEIGVPGEELVPLFATTLSFVAVPLTRIAELDGVIFAGYIDGLRAAGKVTSVSPALALLLWTPSKRASPVRPPKFPVWPVAPPPSRRVLNRPVCSVPAVIRKPQRGRITC